MGLLDGKVAIVTGGAGGQGAAETAALVREGARVVVTDLIEGVPLGDTTRFVKHDVADEAGWLEVVKTAQGEFGGIDILINNAGIYQPAPLPDTDADALVRHFRVNQLGAFLGMKAVIDPMRARGGGVIINIASGLGVMGSPNSFAYSMTKWALRGMSKCASKDLAPDNIRVNSVLPGLIDTPMIARNGAQFNQAIAASTPLARLGLPDDVAKAVLFLCSDAASFITGAELAVDGGLTP